MSDNTSDSMRCWTRYWLAALLVPVAGGCGDDGGASASAGSTAITTVSPDTGTDPTVPTTSAASGSDSSTGAISGTAADSSGGDSGGLKFDLPPGQDLGTQGPTCKVVDDMDAVGDCTDKAPPDAFEPEPQWSFMGPPGFENCIVMPLVANFTDDNDDGEIDLCDVPDVVVVAGPDQGSDTPPSRLYLLDGLTGVEHGYAAELVQFGGTPALGDIDADGLPEIVALSADAHLVAFEHDLTLKWKSAATVPGAQSSAVGLADVDQDGDVEIFVSNQLFDHMGAELWAKGPASIYSATMAADIDGVPGLEILNGDAVFHADGSDYFNLGGGGSWVHAQVANLDDDAEPELLLAYSDRIALHEHDGAPVWSFAPGGQGDLDRPINIHDFDGDTKAEFGVSAPGSYGVYEADKTPLWEAMILDPSGQAGGTAFDFIGGGKAQAVYADEYNVWVFDDVGTPLMNTPHLSGTIIEYPVIADIDNDGSSEILVVSNTVLHGGMVPFTVQAVRDIEDRWVQGRRIWNQHTYHVTNVREDGTIPQVEPKHWELLNTFRTQAQISGSGGVCQPPPPG
ncbi:VCBS repeat-containing protein [Nannocystis sp.]|uniref:FG-GAP repeat domain-containing protein n=1 Tax=Nannocystis sp. TaxID=1962667 RepID=UPI0025E12A44|nr:VCBS repeat-containing protein [Nannocystis sp.]MBK7830673.1 VCBS repeat-containing protein [Nannocystis sp.]